MPSGDYSINHKPLLEDEENTDADSAYDDEPRVSDQTDTFGFPIGSEPRDRYRTGYFTFYLLGMVTLLPFTFFVTANDYWMYKLRDVSLNTTQTNKTALQAEFTSYLTIAATGPAIIFMVVNSLLSNRISTELRMFGSLVIIFLCFIVTTAFVDVDTDLWQDTFFAITLAVVVVVNVFGGILTVSLYGIASKFSSRYISAVSSGQALGGLFPAVVNIGTLALGVSSTHSALLYFCIANVTIILCLAAYYTLSKSLFFQFHMIIKTPVNSLTYDPMDNNSGALSPRLQISLQDVFFKSWEYGLSGLIVYAFTISVYPGVSVLISSVNPSSTWTDRYFVPVITFFVFNLWDYLGRVVAGLVKWPIKRKWLILGMSVARIGFVPLFLLCNAHPRANMPVLINSDVAYVVITCMHAFTNGYLTNCIFINLPRIVESSEQEAASSIIGTFINVGCSIGSLFCFIFVKSL